MYRLFPGSFRRTFVIVFVGALLSACGLKGDLYIPQDDAPEATSTTTPDNQDDTPDESSGAPAEN